MPGVGDPFRQFMPQKDGRSLRWATMARNKRCVTLDLHSEKGKEIFLRLVKRADMVIENFRPGTIEKWGVGYDVMKSVNPKIVLARISGYGQDGPYREKAGFGTAATAFAGYTALQGYIDRAPVSPPVSLADLWAGMYAVMAGLCAVISILEGDRAEGQVVDVSLYEPIVRALEAPLADYTANGKKQVREPMTTTVASPSYIHKTKDGKWVIIIASTQKTWERVPGAIGRPELLTDPRFLTNPDRVAHNAEMIGIMDEWTATLTMDEVCAILDKAGVPACPVYEVDDMLMDPQFIARENIIRVNDPVLGSFSAPSIVPKFSETPCEIRHFGLGLGASNEEVYKGDLGLSDREYEKLKEEKII